MNRLSRSLLRDPRAGFTMVELIATLLVLGILAAFIVPRASDSREATAVDDMNVLRAHIRYVQLKAMSDVVPWGLDIDSDSYSLEINGTAVTNSDHQKLPGINDVERELQTTGLSLTPMRIAFDFRGRPVNPDDDEDVLTADQTITATLSASGHGDPPGSPNPIIITQQTGFLQ